MKWSGYVLAGMLLLGTTHTVQAQCQGGNRSMGGGQMTAMGGGQMTATSSQTASSTATQMAAMQAMCQQQQATQQQVVEQQQAMIRQQMIQQQINNELKRQAMKAELARLGAGPTRAAKMSELQGKLASLSSHRKSARSTRTDQWVATAAN